MRRPRTVALAAAVMLLHAADAPTDAPSACELVADPATDTSSPTPVAMDDSAMDLRSVSAVKDGGVVELVFVVEDLVAPIDSPGAPTGIGLSATMDVHDRRYLVAMDWFAGAEPYATLELAGQNVILQPRLPVLADVDRDMVTITVPVSGLVASAKARSIPMTEVHAQGARVVGVNYPHTQSPAAGFRVPADEGRGAGAVLTDEGCSAA